MRVASEHAGVHSNLLAPTELDRLSGKAVRDPGRGRAGLRARPDPDAHAWHRR
jgi:hypothetical protein